jgi:hypothetical protein
MSEATKETQARTKFIRDILERGEASLVDEDGVVPTLVTHQIVRQSDDLEETELERIRFHMF